MSCYRCGAPATSRLWRGMSLQVCGLCWQEMCAPPSAPASLAALKLMGHAATLDPPYLRASGQDVGHAHGVFGVVVVQQWVPWRGA